MTWDELPSILLEEIYTRLPIRYRYYCSQVCRSWYETFHSPAVWYTFTFDGVIFTRKKFNLFHGYERILNPYRVQFFLPRKSQHIRRLIIRPVAEYNNMVDFLNMLSNFIHYHDYNDYPFPYLEEFSFTFHVLVCIDDNDRNNQGAMFNAYYQHPNAFIRGKKRYYGTGGMILQTLRRFISSLRGLKRFSLNNLLLESNSDIGACLEELLENSSETLEYMEILNYTSHITALYNVGLFSNLNTVSISSHSLNEEVLLLFANHLVHLYRLNIVQDELTIPYRYSEAVWTEIESILKENKRQWFIRMITKGKCKSEPLWPSHPAPVRAIVYDTRSIKTVQNSLYTCMENYSKTLEIYVSTEHGEESLVRHSFFLGSSQIDVSYLYSTFVYRTSGYNLYWPRENLYISSYLSY